MHSLTDKNILLISPEAWGKSLVSKHHYAISLAKRGNRVYFLNPNSEPSLIYQPLENVDLFVVGDVKIQRGLRLLPSFLQRYFFGKAIKRLEQKCKTSFNIVWSFDSSRYFNLLCFRDSIRVFQMMDYRYDFNLAQISSSAHICLGVTDEIVRKQKVYNPQSYFLQHAVHEFTPKNITLPSGKSNVKAFYAGNLLLRFIDRKLVLRILDEFPNVDFFFAGASGIGNLNTIVSELDTAFIKELSSRKNVFLLGEKSPDELPSLMEQSDILLVFYDHLNYPSDVANSHKILSYLAAGKVILANHTEQYASLGLLEMTSSHDEYIKKMSEIIADLDSFNTPELQSQRKLYASEHTYEKQIQKIEKILGTLLS
jgi:hypothetical protein